MNGRTSFLSDVAFRWTWFSRPWTRRLVLAAVALVLAVFSLFPTPYVANVKLIPQDSGSSGLGTLAGQFGGTVATILSGRSPVELNLTIARSFALQSEVAGRLGLVKKNDPDSLGRAVRYLDRHIDVRSLRAGVIQVEAKDHDAVFAMRSANIYSRALQLRLAELSRTQTAAKRRFLEERLEEAGERLDRAQAAITAYRQRNRLVSPNEAFSAAVGQTTGLGILLQQKQMELETTLRFNSEESFKVRSLRAEMVAIRRQLENSQANAGSGNDVTAIGLGNKAYQFAALNREFSIAQGLLDSYRRLLEGTAIERMTADFNMQIIDPPYLEPSIQFNTIPLILFALVMLTGFAAEFYMFRPPHGASRVAT